MLFQILAVMVLCCKGESLSTSGVTSTDLIPLTPPSNPFFPANDHGSRHRRSIKEAPTSNRCHKVAKIPQRMAFRYKLNTTFYGKYTSSYGIPIMSSSFVDNRALQRACYIVRVMLADRKDLRDHLFRNRGRITVMARNQTVPMVPEMWMYENWNGRAVGGTFQNPVNIVGEEHLLCENDNYSREQDILVHEVAHAIHTTASPTADSDIDYWLSRSFDSAKSRGLWNNTYASTDHLEYFAEGVQAYYNKQREGSVGGDGLHNDINTAAELRKYDKTLYKIIKAIFPCRNPIIPRCLDLNQKRGLKQALRMDCDYEELSSPPDGTCKDDNWSCPSWAEIGECKNNPRYMLKSCRRSCGVCSEDPRMKADDIFDHTSMALGTTTSSAIEECIDEHDDCKKWKSHCPTLPHIRNICKLTCNACFVDEYVSTPATEFHLETTMAPSISPSLECTDVSKKCERWQLFCSSASYVQSNCRNTCRLCDATGTTTSNFVPSPTPTADVQSADCTDKHVHCKSWKSFCHSLPHMRTICPHSCETCSHNISTTTPLTIPSVTTTIEATTAGVVEECIDSQPSCRSWKAYCTTDYVAANCKVTCNLCISPGRTDRPAPTARTEGSGAKCVDNDENCSRWRSYCNERYVRRNCKSTCQTCASKDDREVLVVRTVEDFDCRDLDENCPSWTSYCHKQYAQRNCKLSCGTCELTESRIEQSVLHTNQIRIPEGCTDIDSNCGSWTEHCSSNRYVIANCLRTCNLCRREEEILSASSARINRASQVKPTRRKRRRRPKSGARRRG